MFFFSFQKKKYREGFTLPELIVAMGVFVIAFSLLLGAFVRVLKTQRLINHLMSANNNASLILEQMTREIRGGFYFSGTNSAAPGTCPAGMFDTLIFTRARGATNNIVTYTWNTAQGSLDRKEDPPGTTNTFTPLTPQNLHVNRLCFGIKQVAPNDPWGITILLGVGSTNPDLANQTLNLQTSISARILPSELIP